MDIWNALDSYLIGAKNMEIRAIKRQEYRQPDTVVKLINAFHFTTFRNRNAKKVSSGKSAVIIFMNEDDHASDLVNVWNDGQWDSKFKKNIYLYKQKKKPEFSEAIFISNIIMERVKNKTFEDIYIGFRSHKRNQNELVLLQIMPVNSNLSFLIPKYIESIIFGILLEVYTKSV